MALLCALAPTAWASEPLAVRFGPERDYGPFVFTGPGGQPEGLSIDVLRELAPIAGLSVQTLPAADLSDLLALAKAGQLDLLSSLRPDPERSAYLGFTRPYTRVPAVLVTRAVADAASALSALSAQPVAVGKGYGVEAFVRERYPLVRWVAMQNDTMALQKLVRGEVQAVVADLASVQFIRRQHDLGSLQVHGPIGFDYPLAFAWRKDWPELGERLEAALQAVPPQRLTDIQRRWLQGPELLDQTAQWGVRSIAVLLALLLMAAAVLLWGWRRWRTGSREAL